MVTFQSMVRNENNGTIRSFMDNASAILLKKYVSKRNNEKINIECPIHGEKDAIVGVIPIESTVEFVILESCCEFHAKTISENLQPKK